VSRESVLARGRFAAELGMVDTCTIVRVGVRTTDPVTGDVTNPSTTIYTGKCRVQQHQASADAKDIGEDQVFLLRVEVQVPMSVAGLEVGDQIAMTASLSDAGPAGPGIPDPRPGAQGRGDRAPCAVRGEDGVLTMPSQSLRFDTAEVAELADLLVRAAGVAPAEARKVVAKGAAEHQDRTLAAPRSSSLGARAGASAAAITYDSHETPSGGWA
jgi:hypothetical protein